MMAGATIQEEINHSGGGIQKRVKVRMNDCP